MDKRCDTLAGLGSPFELPCGVRLKNRLIKSAMSDSLGDGAGLPTAQQGALYARWARGGLAAAIIGEVQADPSAPEKPGNLVLHPGRPEAPFRHLARTAADAGGAPWLQLGHAGALAHPPIGRPRGPSALDLPGLRCDEISAEEIATLPDRWARTARMARDLGFGGVQIHAAHGFLLSQFLSPLFNRRGDAHGGPVGNRCRLLLGTVEAVRAAVGPDFPVAVKLNASDGLTGGLSEDDSLDVVRRLDAAPADLIEISGGTYFPGAPAASDRGGHGPYYERYAARARRATSHPLMLVGGVKSARQAAALIAGGTVDLVGVARAMVIDPDLPRRWLAGGDGPDFPRFGRTVPGGVTAWYTLRLAALAEGREDAFDLGLEDALAAYDRRDAARVPVWNAAFADG